MSRIITTISFMLSGASVLIFMLALLIPVLRETPSLGGKLETAGYELSGFFKKTIDHVESELSQRLAVNNERQSSIMQPQAEIAQNESSGLPASTQAVGNPGVSSTVTSNEVENAQNTGEGSTVPSQQTLPETVSPQINGHSTRLDNPMVAEEKQSPSPQPMSLPVSGKDLIPAGEVTPKAKEAVEELGPEPAQSPTVNNEIQAAIAPPEAEVAPDETTIAQNRGESSTLQSQQTSPETTRPASNEKSTEPANPVGTEERRSTPRMPMSLLVLGEGMFTPGEVTPNANIQKAIDKIILLINAQPQDQVLVEGHADKWIPDGVSAEKVSNYNKFVSSIPRTVLLE